MQAKRAIKSNDDRNLPEREIHAQGTSEKQES